MKKYILRLLAVLIFVSATVSSCTVEYREHHHMDHDHGHAHDDHDYRNH